MPTLDWIGKRAVVTHHTKAPFHLLKPRADLSLAAKPDTTDRQHLIVQGDNLLGLKTLLPRYAGQVKCIYIDPPYNTGNEGWVYNDAVNSPEMRAWLGKTVGAEAEDLTRHDKWLCMMYPRLALLRQFLREDGVILVSIDDFEAYRLRYVLDEVFGEQNFIAQLVWEKGRKNDAKLFSIGHEYLIIYALSKEYLRKNNITWREPKLGAKEIWLKYLELKKEFSEDNEKIETALQKWYKSLHNSHPSKKLSRYKHVDKDGPWRDRDISWPGGGGPRYEVIHPITRLPCQIPERGWGFANEIEMQRQISVGLVVFREDHTKPPFRKAHLRPIQGEIVDDAEDNSLEALDEEMSVGLQVMSSVIYKQSQVAVKSLRNLMGGKVFENPKDSEIIARLINYVTSSDKNAIILDSFAGSGTTAHAVMALNAEDGGQRKCILVEMNAHIAQNITAERVRRVIAREGWGDGFEYCELGETLFDPSGDIRSSVSYADLAEHVFFVETGCVRGQMAATTPPLVGLANDTAVYLLYNGVLKDKAVNSGNVLTPALLASLPPHLGRKVIYGTACRLSAARLQAENITFRQIPYDVRQA